MTAQLIYTCFKSSFDWVGLAKSDCGLARLIFGAPTKKAAIDRLFDGVESAQPVARDAVRPAFADAVDSLTRYFNGDPVDFALALDLEAGTPFQREVWQIARRIPYGEVRSYAWIAREMGRLKAVRAVGGAMGANPLPIVVPCHRVIRSDGGLGGYSGGLPWKRQLLALERQM